MLNENADCGLLRMRRRPNFGCIIHYQSADATAKAALQVRDGRKSSLTRDILAQERPQELIRLVQYAD